MEKPRANMRIEKVQKPEKLRTRHQIADDMTFLSIPWYLDHDLSELSLPEGKEDEFWDGLSGLMHRGCDPSLLVVFLRLGKSIVKRVREQGHRLSVPKAARVKSLANKMRRLAKEIEDVESSYFMTVLNRAETAKWLAETGVNPEEMDELRSFPFLFLPHWLGRRASMYEEWAGLATQKIPPKDIGLRRLGHLCVALYVKFETGRTHFHRVSALLESAGIGHYSVAQLSRELREFESRYPWTCGHLKLQLALMKKVGVGPRDEVKVPTSRSPARRR
jgi:hypothetical protein